MKNALLLLCVVMFSCNWAKQKTKDTVNKTGEVVAKAGSEFADGVSKGVEKTFQSELKFSDALSKKGIKSGKILISSSDSARDNVLTAYLIFENDFDQKVTVKIFNESGQEYGRVVQTIKGIKGEAGYVDFVFDKRTNIDGKSKVLIE